MRAPATDYDALAADLAAVLPRGQLVTEPLRRLAYGTDASFYRRVPRLIALVACEDEVAAVLAACTRHRAPLTFRAAGTSLSGQAISDSVLVLLGEGWRGHTLGPDAATIRLGVGLRGSEANRLLAAHGRKIGPDPASLDTAMIGGIAANNASGMCCGTRDNSYHTLVGLRLVLADGTRLDTEDAASRAAFRARHGALLLGLATLMQQVRRDTALAARIRHKYRMKNTTGYGLNALLDFDDPIDTLAHLMIGSEGTLAFIASVTYRTLPDYADRATALVFFPTLRAACEAVLRLKPLPVDAVELMDRAALRAVAGAPGLPAALHTLPETAAALLVETRAADAPTLAAQIEQVSAALAAGPLAGPLAFTTDAAECAALWKVRKGTFPAVGAVRRPGTTVIIEDVAFPVARLADATGDLQALLGRHGYLDGPAPAIIFGHALEGNLHFVFTQDFGSAAEVQRYARLMDALAELVVDRYDGALKAEHGTGRNMAPFVGREWGEAALAAMHEIKRLFDPLGLLNPGVILADDPQAHLRDLKPLPAADPAIDRCIECGFCEPKCPSAGLSFSPRQRIVGRRELARRAAAGEDTTAIRAAYDYLGIATCAGCGLCATACPVHIDTGQMIKGLRGAAHGPLAQRVGTLVAERYAAVSAGVRGGLALADRAHGALGTAALGALARGARRLSARVPLWTEHLPRPARRLSVAAAAAADGPAGLAGAPAGRAAAGAAAGAANSAHAGATPAGVGAPAPIVYFPSCAARTMGPARGDPADDLPTVTARVLRRAGFAPFVPAGCAGLCCGQPFESKGLSAQADAKSAELAAALAAALTAAAAAPGAALSTAGNPAPPAIVFDTSPCAYRMQRYVQAHGLGLQILDITEALHDLVLPRLRLRPVPGCVAVHPVCSLRKMGLDARLLAVAQACSAQVVLPAEVHCCGWAGDKGWTVPELNAHALRHLRTAIDGCTHGVATSRTCEIGLAAHGGVTYRSIAHLVDAASGGR